MYNSVIKFYSQKSCCSNVVLLPQLFLQWKNQCIIRYICGIISAWHPPNNLGREEHVPVWCSAASAWHPRPWISPRLSHAEILLSLNQGNKPVELQSHFGNDPEEHSKKQIWQLRKEAIPSKVFHTEEQSTVRICLCLFEQHLTKLWTDLVIWFDFWKKKGCCVYISILLLSNFSIVLFVDI